MKVITSKNIVMKNFYLLSDYLKKEGKIEDEKKYKNNFSAFLLHAHHIKIYDFIAPFCKNKRVLDVGCFIGYGETRILEAKEIVAIDSDDRALEFARKNSKLSNVKFQKVDARNLPFQNEIFDVVIASQLIEHIPPIEINNFLLSVKRILKKGGLFFCITPNRKFRLLPFQKPFNLEHYQEFTAKSLLKTLKTIFKNVQIKGLRAAEWIEKIESNRVRTSPYRLYIWLPMHRFLNIILPMKIIRILKNIKFKLTKLYQNESKETSIENNLFNNLFRRFYMDDFYLEEQNNLIDKSMDIVGICKND